MNSSGQLGDGTLTQRLTTTQTQLLNIYFYDLEGDGYGGELLPSEEACEPPGTEYVENDLDCDDFDPAINPGAAEVCDGLDNNCNVAVDEATGSTWYRDLDADTYGNAAVSTLACVQPSGYVSNSSDCDDSKASVKPGASEVCDGLDNNCNGSIDEATGSTWYRDADGDTYGNASVSTLACSAPAGYVSNSSDCDDSKASVKPGATEVCNGVDDNCTGSIDEGLPVTTWYRDADGDGRGNPSVSAQKCSAPTGYVSNSDDCNDADSTLPRHFPTDDDKDGYGASFVVGPTAPSSLACYPPPGYASTSGDCDDSRASVHPGAPATKAALARRGPAAPRSPVVARRPSASRCRAPPPRAPGPTCMGGGMG
jgi:hypothetical protein